MKIKARILRRDRTIKIVEVDPDREFLKFKDGLYVMSPSSVNEGDTGPEIYFFEGNPTALNVEKRDSSEDFIDSVVLSNFLDQVGEIPQGFGFNFGFLKTIISNPQYLVGTMLALAVAYSLFVGGFKP